MLLLIGKSSQEAQVKWLALIEDILKKGIYIHVALRLNRSKCTWHWPKAHETRHSRSPAEKLVGQKLWFVGMPTVTATLPAWEGSELDFRIWGGLLLERGKICWIRKDYSLPNSTNRIYSSGRTDSRRNLRKQKNKIRCRSWFLAPSNMSLST